MNPFQVPFIDDLIKIDVLEKLEHTDARVLKYTTTISAGQQNCVQKNWSEQ